MSDWSSKIRAELKTGKKAQQAGNEGMARVCARRAAGWVANAYLEQEGIALTAKSGFEKLVFLLESDLLSKESSKRLKGLTRSLEKDNTEGESYWPLEVNLLDEAEKLAEELLPSLSI